jgi:hypothetical protein
MSEVFMSFNVNMSNNLTHSGNFVTSGVGYHLRWKSETRDLSAEKYLAL